MCALYHKYRPGSFAELVGQQQVSGPLSRALDEGRIHHAYLFSGPRGCGKTSTARILARSINCHVGPTSTPCGQCESCVALAPNGAGHVDVVELDAASNGGVDDARSLREKVLFASVASRWKIYIIDEAHMISPQAFNALLKVVEEPPPATCFIFATTEPERVLTTIRSRTFHYRLRLFTPEDMVSLLSRVCAEEGVTYEPSALSLVVRAGGGSPRDSESILDQLVSGSEGRELTYAETAAALGSTDTANLRDIVQAMANRDGGGLFKAVDHAIAHGGDPQRIAKDLLELLRDLLLLTVLSGDRDTAPTNFPLDFLHPLLEGRSRMSQTFIYNAAEVLAKVVSECKGAVPSRFVLEFALARTIELGGRDDHGPIVDGSTVNDRSSPALPTFTGAHSGLPQASTDGTYDVSGDQHLVDEGTARNPASPIDAKPIVADGAERLRASWRDILDAVRVKSRVAWIQLEDYAQIEQFDQGQLTLTFTSPAIAAQFERRSHHLKQAVRDVLDAEVDVVCTSRAGGAALA